MNSQYQNVIHLGFITTEDGERKHAWLCDGLVVWATDLKEAA